VCDDTPPPTSCGLNILFGYGEELEPGGGAGFSFPSPRLFTDHERDRHGGSEAQWTDDLDYMHARYYSPLYGRFLGVDPVRGVPSAPQSWNRYAYVEGNSINYRDTDGRQGIYFIDPCFFSYCDTTGSTGGGDPLPSIADQTEYYRRLVDDLMDVPRNEVDDVYYIDGNFRSKPSISKLIKESAPYLFVAAAMATFKGRDAKRRESERVDSVAREFGIDGPGRKEFGKYIEAMKEGEGRGGQDNFTREDLRELARIFLEEFGER
jgi:RHS repeat-associated protein